MKSSHTGGGARMERGARRIAAMGALVGAFALAACGGEARDEAAPMATLPTEWGAPAAVAAVQARGDDVVVSGRAEPGVRVVLVEPLGRAFASAAGAGGGFEVRLPRRSAPTLYRTEIHTGPSTVLAGDWLVVTPGADGVAAALSPGGPARLVQGRRLLGALDYDGAGLVVSGWAAPGQTVDVRLDDQPAVAARADADGRYAARFPATPPGPRRVRAAAGSRAAAVEAVLSAPPGQGLTVTPASGWVRIDWPLPGGGAQSTWILTAAS